MSNTGFRYVSKLEDGGYSFVLPNAMRREKVQTVYRQPTLPLALAKRQEILGYDPDASEQSEPTVTIEPPINQAWTPAELWDRAFTVQDQIERTPPDYWYTIEIDDNKPIAIAWMSDIHFGSPYTDYRQVWADTETITNTPGMWAIGLGDDRDNWVATKLTYLQRRQEMTFDAEVSLYKSWIEMIKPKLLADVTGNHDLWTHKIGGLDLARLLLPDRILYDKYEIRMVLKLGGAEWRIICRHKWPYNSIYNPTHGMEMSWERAGKPYDIALGGDTHIATICREFIREGKVRFAILLGTYKLLGDPFPYELGKANCPHVGSGAVIFWPSGQMLWVRDVKTAAKFLEWARS